MVPFTIATGTSYFTENIFIRIHTDAGFYGVGECSTFPAITGETQTTCFELSKDFASILKSTDPLQVHERLDDLHRYIDFAFTTKSAFDMALHDIAARHAGVPLYKFLGGQQKILETDLTIGIDTPKKMADTAVDFVHRGVRIIKIKLGKNATEDIERVRLIRAAVGNDLLLRIDANQGWTFDDASRALREIAQYNIEFCEQPLHHRDDELLPALRKLSPIKIMADESVFDHLDARRLIAANACDYVNIKFAKSGGIREAHLVNAVCEQSNIPCMMGGMVESRVALTCFGHFALAHPNVRFYDMDTCMLGHKLDPVKGGIQFDKFFLHVPETPGSGADIDDAFLSEMQSARV